LEVSDKEWQKQKEDGDKKTAADDGSENAAVGTNGDHVTAMKSQGLSEYEINKVKNVAKLKQQLAEVDKNYPLPEEFRGKKDHRKPASSKKGKAPWGDVVN